MRLRKSKRQATEGNEHKCATFRISIVTQTTNHSFMGNMNRQAFAERTNKIKELPNSKSTTKISTKHTLGTSSYKLRNRTAAMLSLSRLVKLQASDFSQVIALEINRKLKLSVEKGDVSCQLKKLFYICQKMSDQIFSYESIEAKIRELNETVKGIGSSTLIYRVFIFSGQCFFEYGSFSLSLYYFDCALKSYYDRDNPGYFIFERKLQIQVYKYVGNIFLLKGRYSEAKAFAYKYLRKAWLLNDVNHEMSAYDLLGKIYMEMQSISMCRYFHYRMSSGKRQSPELMLMSKQEMQKQTEEKVQFACYQTINVFIDKSAAFNEILENHYRMRSLEHSQQIGVIDNEVRQVYIYTHRSPNRLLDNYHLLERKMIEAKSSKELHFIRPKVGFRLRKLFWDFSGMVNQIRQNIQNTNFASQFTLKTIAIKDSKSELSEEQEDCN